MPTQTLAHEQATIKLAALRKLHTLMLETDDPSEARRCATAILRAPTIEVPAETPDPTTNDTKPKSPVTITNEDDDDDGPHDEDIDESPTARLTRLKIPNYRSVEQIHQALTSGDSRQIRALVHEDVLPWEEKKLNPCRVRSG